MEPAGLLVGAVRGSELRDVRIAIHHLKRAWAPPPEGLVSTRERSDHTALAMTVAKIGYCHAVFALGLSGFDGSAIRDLLCDRRADVYNFVGGRLSSFPLTDRYLHKLYLRRAADYVSVVVHLFAAYGLPAYEVVAEGGEPLEQR